MDGQANGKGTLTFPNYDFYCGDFVDGRRHGHGMYLYEKYGLAPPMISSLIGFAPLTVRVTACPRLFV